MVTRKHIFSDYRHYFIPSFLGAFFAFLFTGDLILSSVIFLAVWFGNWIGYSLLKK